MMREKMNRAIVLLGMLGMLWPAVSFCNQGETTSDLGAYYRKFSELKDSASVEKIEVLVWLANHYSQDNVDSAKFFAQKALVLSEVLEYPLGIAKANLEYGRYLFRKGELGFALDHLEKAYDGFQVLNDSVGMARSLSTMGSVYLDWGAFNKSADVLFAALNYLPSGNYLDEVASIYNRIALIFSNQKKYSEALEYHEKNLEYHKSVGNKKGIFQTLNNIGVIYYNLKGYQKAMEYAQQAYEIARTQESSLDLGIALTNIGEYTGKAGDYQKGLPYLQKGLKIFQENNFRMMMAVNMGFIAQGYLTLNKYPLSIEYARKSLAIAQKERALKFSMEANETLYKAYQRIGNPELALKYHVAYKQYSDSLFNREQIRASESAENRYLFEKKKQELQVQQKEAELLNQQKLERQWWITFAAIMTSLGIAGFAFLIFRNRQKVHKANKALTEANQRIILQKDEILTQAEELQQQAEELQQTNEYINSVNEEIRVQNQRVTDSINYARRIQTAMLPISERIDGYIGTGNWFIFNQPRDIVSGDFYWWEKHGDLLLFAVGDCTGHGVPGALMSMIGNQMLYDAVKVKNITDPGDILSEIHVQIRRTLQQENSDNHDGMDMAVCSFHPVTRELNFAGAMSPLLVFSEGKMKRLKGTRRSLGGLQVEKERNFETISLLLPANSWVYLFSDGFIDQLGGEERNKFGIDGLMEVLINIHSEKPERQTELLWMEIENWMNQSDCALLDDMLIMGARL